jgi:hypothetical protein
MMQVRTILVGTEAYQGSLLGDDGGVVVAARNGDPGQRLVAAATTARWLVRGSQGRAQDYLLLVQAATQLAKLRTAETKQGSSGHNRQLLPLGLCDEDQQVVPSKYSHKRAYLTAATCEDVARGCERNRVLVATCHLHHTPATEARDESGHVLGKCVPRTKLAL